MMHIKIAQRQKPFSHTPGMFYVLPGSSLRFQIFPTLVRVHDLFETEPKFITNLKLNITGPVEDFTVQLDLEKGCIGVWGHAQEGFVHYRIAAVPETESFAITIKRCPEKGIQWLGLNRPSKRDDSFVFSNQELKEEHVVTYQPPSQDWLALGSHKKQDWDLVKRRLDLAEILPVWMKLGQLIPSVVKPTYEGTAAFLKECQTAIEEKDKLGVYQTFMRLFLAGFEGIMSPRLVDSQHQGFHLEKPAKGSSLVLLTEGAHLIRKMFVDVKKKTIQILPVLPPEFHSGRMIGVVCEDLGTLDIEWTKKRIRRMIFRPYRAAEVQFSVQSKIKRYRLREGKKERGEVVLSEGRVEVTEGNVYLFDNFQK